MHSAVISAKHMLDMIRHGICHHRRGIEQNRTCGGAGAERGVFLYFILVIADLRQVGLSHSSQGLVSLVVAFLSQFIHFAF